MAVRSMMKQQVALWILIFLCVTVNFVSSVDTPKSQETDLNSDTQDKDGKNVTNNESTKQNSQPTKPPTSAGNCTDCNESHYLQKITELYEKGTIRRAFYVLIAITGIVIVYFVIRTVKSKSRKSKSKKYGVISMPGNDLEMAPLDADDEEDDVTVFEANGRK